MKSSIIIKIQIEIMIILDTKKCKINKMKFLMNNHNLINLMKILPFRNYFPKQLKITIILQSYFYLLLT